MKAFLISILALVLNPVPSLAQEFYDGPIVEMTLWEASIQRLMPEIVKQAAWANADDWHPFYYGNIERIFKRAKMQVPFTKDEIQARYRDNKKPPFEADQLAQFSGQFYDAIKASVLEVAKDSPNIFFLYFETTVLTGRDLVRTTQFLFRDEPHVQILASMYWIDLSGGRFPVESLGRVSITHDFPYESCWIPPNLSVLDGGPPLRELFASGRVPLWKLPSTKGRIELGVRGPTLSSCTPVSRADNGRFYIDLETLRDEWPSKPELGPEWRQRSHRER